MSWSNQARHTEWHETCECKCRRDSSVCNNKQGWNEEKCRCKFREELIDKGKCDKGFIWKRSNFNCECDKSCDIGEYLGYKNCKCKKRIVGELFCIVKIVENIDETEMIYNGTLNAIRLNDYKKACYSCILYIVLFAIFLVTSTIISTVFIYFH